VTVTVKDARSVEKPELKHLEPHVTVLNPHVRYNCWSPRLVAKRRDRVRSYARRLRLPPAGFVAKTPLLVRVEPDLNLRELSIAVLNALRPVVSNEPSWPTAPFGLALKL
jgi:hypothetical protein